MSSLTQPAAQPATQASLQAQAAPQPQSRTITPTTSPIALLSDPTAKAYTHIHPVLVLTLFRLRFSALVEDPVPELLQDLVPLAILQVLYVVLCLPPTSSSVAKAVDAVKSGKSDSKAKGPRRDSRKGPAGLGKRITTALLALPLALVPGVIILTTFLILFGAPLTTHHAHTVLLGAHVSLLAAFPLIYTHGIDRTAWWEIAAFLLPADEVWGGTIGTFVGAWLGAVPIPLDWDREWQKWPVTILAGAYLGWAVGRWIGGFALRGKRINFEA